MTSRQRLEAIFAGQMVDRIPFSLKGWRVPQCQAELELRQSSLSTVDLERFQALLSALLYPQPGLRAAPATLAASCGWRSTTR